MSAAQMPASQFNSNKSRLSFFAAYTCTPDIPHNAQYNDKNSRFTLCELQILNKTQSLACSLMQRKKKTGQGGELTTEIGQHVGF